VKFSHFSRLSIISLWLLTFQVSWGAGYVPVARVAGGAVLDANAIATALGNNMLGAANPTDVGTILGAEIANNNVRFQIPSQKGLLSAHLVNQGHYVDWYAAPLRRMGAASRPILSRYALTGGDDGKTFDLCQQITSEVLDLLLSGHVSFSVGAFQYNGAVPLPGAHPANGFVLYANLAGHAVSTPAHASTLPGLVANLNDPSGQHSSAGGVIPMVTTDTNYLRIAIQVKESLPDATGVNVLQVVIITVFHENPASTGLRDSILPNGVDAMGHPLGTALGPPLALPDNRIPAVS
jgi:hypothetical protein